MFMVCKNVSETKQIWNYWVFFFRVSTEIQWREEEEEEEKKQVALSVRKK